eukprot:1189164-Prorocentrum_minimum.AAC.1
MWAYATHLELCPLPHPRDDPQLRDAEPIPDEHAPLHVPCTPSERGRVLLPRRHLRPAGAAGECNGCHRSLGSKQAALERARAGPSKGLRIPSHGEETHGGNKQPASSDNRACVSGLRLGALLGTCEGSGASSPLTSSLSCSSLSRVK